MTTMQRMRLVVGCAAVAMAVLVAGQGRPVAASGAEPGRYRVLKAIQSGDLTLFPVVRTDGKAPAADQFLTLDEGLKSGEVEVTEAGKVRGLVRSRGTGGPVRYEGDQVNTLVLVNHAKRPLLLLAGEIVTGGKQDRIIAKDRIVPAGGEPIDLSVFCIEHGRWTESSAKFGVAASLAATRGSSGSFMVQPAVRQQAMVAKDQQQVWNAVSGAISTMAAAAAPPPTPNGAPRSLGTTSYAKAMTMDSVAVQVDKQAAGLAASHEEVLAQLRQEHAVGVVVAVRGEVIWTDIFSDSGLLTRYWTKLLRSYAAEGLGGAGSHGAATMADAQSFLDVPAHGREDSEGETGVYRVREVKSDGTDLYTLESLLPGTGYDVHVSRLKLKGTMVGTAVQPSVLSRPVF